ncbi:MULTISPECIES: Gfo/Idh/MocA family protein [Acidobacteriaceae]|uniref:Gfo/Idh/MocA family protein n=1 Tax=Acidobacteriaceae TaxID=204434 RepID=UPI00131E9211|nr:MULTISPECIES: Gfo/Idh/MocA family oxidoreductase [Acidobacteriaceae]MDW5267179.1 Gfo/Idh/MocA family oxidoreductase [Edaphobacter sp.]
MSDELRGVLDDLSRRNFLRLGGITAVGMSVPQLHAEAAKPQGSSVIGMKFAAKNPKIGIIGVGGRGTSLLGNLLAADAQILAVCDIAQEHAEHAQSLVVKAGQPSPELYTKGDHAFESLVARDDLDLVIIATPWDWHVPMAVAAMTHGKHVAVEVPAAATIEDCWKLVNTSERTQRHCMMLENCCYGYNETLILRMTHEGLFGDLLYGEGAYLHDLREELFSNKGEGLWRRTVHTERNGNLYPTHGLGPVANYMGIQRGDRFDYIVSMSTPQLGLDAYRKAHLPSSDPRWSERYITGDMSTSLIKTANGRTITLQNGTVNPHPYSRTNLIAGTKGLFADYPPRIYLDGQAGGEEWATIDSWKDHQHPLWKREGEIAQKLGGHGGMDYIMLYRLLECMRNGLAPDMDVYDAATWSAPGPLSRLSVADGSAPAKFPDFTRDRWKERSVSQIATQT